MTLFLWRKTWAICLFLTPTVDFILRSLSLFVSFLVFLLSLMLLSLSRSSQCLLCQSHYPK